MAIAQHRAPTAYALPTIQAAALAVVIGVLLGVAIAMAIFPDAQGFATGVSYGLILGIPAAVAVVFARRAAEQGARPWLVGLVGVLGVTLIAALLFALTQADPRLAPVGAALGAITGAASLFLGLRLARPRREVPHRPLHRRD